MLACFTGFIGSEMERSISTDLASLSLRVLDSVAPDSYRVRSRWRMCLNKKWMMVF